MRNHQQALPNAFILGAAKAGTTTIYNLLKQHSQVFLSFNKEPMFYSRDDFYARGVDWYCKTYFSKSFAFPVRAEATPHYLYWAQKVSPRIKETHPDGQVKFIVILRNPIERAYSWYWNMVADGRETLPFLDALKAEEQRLQTNWTELQYYGSMQYGYFQGGCYASQIENFLQDFKESQFHFLLLEDLENKSEIGIHNLFDFLGVQDEDVSSPTASNVAAKPRASKIHGFLRNRHRLKELLKPLLPARFRYTLINKVLAHNLRRFEYPAIDNLAKAYLQEKFRPEINRLMQIIKRDLSDWL